jgi:hypothetical protein
LSRRSRESRQFRVVRPEIGAVTADRREIFPKFGTNVPVDGTIVVIVTTIVPVFGKNVPNFAPSSSR